ncbi:MAG: hypothetical protein JSS02_15765, partial [Planctomycetes bacterium]|nr:hypothetical protein [Planctomycetota bacterium]
SIATLAGNVGASFKGTAGIGFAFAYNNVHDTVSSLIDNSIVMADTGNITVDATFAKPTALPPGLDTQIAALAVSGGGAQDIAGAGSVSLNWIHNEVTAKISNIGDLNNTAVHNGADLFAGNALSVTASDTSTANSITGAISIAGVGAKGASGAIGASVSYTFLGGDPNDPLATGNNVVNASIEHIVGSVRAGTLDVHANYNGKITNITVAGAVAGSFALGGAISINRIRNASQAYITDATDIATSLKVTPSVNIKAEDQSTIFALAGGVGLAIPKSGKSGVAAGVSIAINQTHTDTAAYIENSKVTSAGSIDLTAHSTPKITAWTIGVAVADGGGGQGLKGSGAGAGSGNTIDCTTEAYILNCGGARGVFANGGGVTLSATDDSTIMAIAGALAVAGLFGGSDISASVGISVAVNEITNHVHAYIDTSIVHAAGALTITASQDKAQITAYTVGGAIARSKTVAITVGVTVADNNIASDVKAYISGSNDVQATSGGSVTITATQTSSITAYCVAASVAVATGSEGFAISGGGASATNEISGNANAYIADGAVTSAADVTITSTANGTITAIVVGLAVAGSGGPAALGIGVSLATNRIGKEEDDDSLTPFEVRSYISKASVSAPNGSLSATATSTSTISAVVVAASVAVTAKGELGVSLGGAGSNATNQVATWIQAAIDGDGATGIHAKGITLKATDTSSISSVAVGAAIAASIAGEVGASISIGVSLADNEIRNRVEATIANADDVNSTGAITVSATSHASIHTVSVAASVSAAISQTAGIAISGAGAESTNVIHSKTNALVQNSALTATGNVSVTAEAGSASPGDKLTPAVSADIFTSQLDDAAKTELLDSDTTISNVLYKKGTPNPTDYNSDNTVKTTVRNLLAQTGNGIEMSTNPDDLAVTVRKVDPGASETDSSDDTGLEWSVTDRTTGKSVIIVKNKQTGTFTVSTPEISAVVVGASVAVGVGAEVGAGLAIGAAVAHNLIGTEQKDPTDAKSAPEILKNEPGEVQAQILNSSVNATGGTLTVTATAQQSIDAFVGAFSAAVGGSGGVGLAAGGAGVYAVNGIAMTVAAVIDGDATAGIHAKTVTVSATDTSSISTVAGAATLAVAFGGEGAIAIAVGVAIADNSVQNVVQAKIDNAHDLTTTVGAVTVTASETAAIDSTTFAAAAAIAVSEISLGEAVGFLLAQNKLSNAVQSSITDSHVTSAAGVTVSTFDQGTIDATTVALSIAGGVVGVGVSGGLVDNTIGDNVLAAIESSTITASGDILVTATSTPSVSASATTVSVSIAIGAAASLFAASTNIGGTTKVSLADDVLTAVGHSIKAQAKSTETVNPVIRGGAGGLIGIGVMFSDATVVGTTLATLGGTNTITSGGLEISATDTSSATPVTNVGSVGGVAVSTGITQATLSRETSATILDASVINLMAGSLSVSATTSTKASTTSRSTGGGVIGVSALQIDSKVNSTTKASVGAGATIAVPTTNTAGDITVTAVSQNFAEANTANYGGGGINIAISLPNASDTSTTEAEMLGNIGGPNGAASGAANLTVEVTANDRALSGAAAAGGGLVQVGVATVTATASPKVHARIGGQVTVTKDLVVQADSRVDADATNTSAGGGAVAVTVLDDTVTVAPVVTVEVKPNAQLNAGEDLIITSMAGYNAPVNDTDNTSSSSASGAAGGLVQVSAVTTNLTMTPQSTTTIGAGAKLTAVQSVDIESTANATGSAVAEGDGGGIVSVGISNSTITIDTQSQVVVEKNAVIRAPGSPQLAALGITILSTTREDAFGKGRGVSGGLVAVAGATVTTNVSHHSSVDIGESVTLETPETLLVEALSSTKATADSDITAGGGVAVATNTTTLNLGSSSDNALTSLAIGKNALLKGKAVTIGARVTKLDLTNTADEEADGLGSGANANALTTVYDKTIVTLAGGSSVTGDTVTINSTHEDLSLSSSATATAYALVGIPNAEAKIDYNGSALITTDPGSLVSAGTINVNASQQFTKFDRYAREFAWQNGSGGSAGDENGALNATREIDWNGDLAVLSAPNPELEIDKNGKITKLINVTLGTAKLNDTLATSTVSVDPINNSNSDLSKSITMTAAVLGSQDGLTAPASIIKGHGTLSTAAAFQTVTLTNHSSKDLVINGIQTVNLNAHPTVNLIANQVTGFTFDVSATVPPTDIRITSDGTGSNVVLNSPSAAKVPVAQALGYSIYNPIGTTQILAPHGAILNKSGSSNTPTIWTRTLDLLAGKTVGANTADRLNVNLVLATGQTDLKIAAGDSVFLNLQGRVRSSTITDALFIGSTIVTPGLVDLLIQPTQREVETQGTAGTTFAYRINTQTPAQPGDGVSQQVNSDSSGPEYDPRVFPSYSQATAVDAAFQFDLIQTGGNLTINSPNPATDARVSFKSDTIVPGNVAAHLGGSISLTERSGDFHVDTIWSEFGDVALATLGAGASILGVANDSATPVGQTPWVIGNGVSLSARDGSIGTATDFLEINSSYQALGAVIALATDGVYLAEISGNLNVDKVLSRVSDVVLVAKAGSILEYGDDPEADVQGRKLDLIATAAGATIGTAVNALEILGGGSGQRPTDGFEIEPYAPATGRLVAQANNGIALTEMSGAVNVLDVNTPNGDLFLTVHDSVLNDENLNVLETPDTTFFGTTLSKGRILANKGNVTVEAGDHVTLPTGASIKGGTTGNKTVTIRGGQLSNAPKDFDVTGAILTLAGDIVGEQVEIYGGSNLDYIDLINPAGINAPTKVAGLAGDDRFFVQAAPAALTLMGGAGADRFYLSSNAARSLFLVNGVFNDLGTAQDYPFSKLTQGTLATFTAPVSIDAGSGANGAARDGLYLSAAGRPTAITDGLVTASQITNLGNTTAMTYSPGTAGIDVFVKLTGQSDTMRVAGAGTTTQVFVYAGAGDDTLNVGQDGSPLADLSGIVAFFGEAGSNDILNVYGQATPPSQGTPNVNQVTSIGVTGLGSGTNTLVGTHNDLFGADYTIGNLNSITPTLDGLTTSQLQSLADALSAATRPIDTYLNTKLPQVARDALLDFQTGAEIVFRVNNQGPSPISGLTANTVYYVSSVDASAVYLVHDLNDQSQPVAVLRTLIGENSNQVTLAHLDSGSTAVINVSPTQSFSGNLTIVNNQIKFGAQHNLSNGQQVVYHVTAGNTPIGGLTDGQVYYVIKIDDTTIKLSASADLLTAVTLTSPSGVTPDTVVALGTALFNAHTNVDAAEDSITFTTVHDFASGQAVVYHASNIVNNGGNGTVTSVGGLTDGNVYYVVRISPTKIKLATNANGSGLIDLTPIAATTSTFDSFTTARSFELSSVSNSTIVFAKSPGFTVGQAVVYNHGDGTRPAGLADGTVLYVSFVNNDPKKIQLATAPGGTALTFAGGTGTANLSPAATFDPTALHVSNNQITFTQAHGLVNGQKIVYRVGPGHTAIGGLTDGQPYYVTVVDADTIQLSTSLGGNVVQLDTTTTAGLVPVVTTPRSQLVTQAFNDLINSKSVYDASRFAGVDLRPETLQLLSQYPQGNPVLNRLLLEDAYPELTRLTGLVPQLPASVYYAQRFVSRSGTESIISTVEQINIHLSGTTNSLQVDSTFGGTTTIDGGTDTTVTLGSSLSAYHAATNKRLQYVTGTVSVSAQHVIFDDSGNDQSTTGTLNGNQVTGLGIPGSVTLVGTPSTTIRLGANNDTFYVAGTSAGQSYVLETGGGYDKVYLGTTPGAENTGSLSGLKGSLLIDGGSVLTGIDSLFINDQATKTAQNFVVTNDYDWTAANNSNSTVDTTTITRGGQALVQYRHEEIVVLSAGAGNDTIDIQQTHREQSTDGSASSSLTVNGGAGDDSITLGAPVGGGLYSMRGFQQDVDVPVFSGSNASPRGVPVVINVQGGDDAVIVRDTGETSRTSLGLTQTEFRDLFPLDRDAAFDYADVFSTAFGENALSRPFTTVALAVDSLRPVNVNVRETINQASRLTGQNVRLTVSLGTVPTGSGNVVQLTSARYETDVTVNAGGGQDTFNVENGVRMASGHTLTLSGQGGNDSAFVDFNGVSIIDRGALGHSLANVSYSRDDSDPGQAGHTPLTPGTYFVETRFNGSQWQFRMVDSAGLPVAVADLSDPTGTTLVANWQNIQDLPVASSPTNKQGLVSHFASHRGVVLDFSGVYRASGTSLTDSMKLSLATDATNVVNGVTVSKYAALGQTVSQVAFAAGEVAVGHALNGATYYVQTQWSGTSWQFRIANGSNNPIKVANVAGAGFTENWQDIRQITPEADGSRVFHSGTGLVITFNPEYPAGVRSTATAAELLLGVPQTPLAFTFDGGTQAIGGGDRLDIAGDGQATGGVYLPSSSVPGGGEIQIGGTSITFSGVEPLVVHGLPDFKMQNADQAAVLTLDSAQLAATSKDTLQLHTLTVDGQVTWTQKKQFTLDNPALDPRTVGRSIAVSSDGLTMVVGAKATAGGATTGNLSDGMVLVYSWNGSFWEEQARLEPSDLRLGANFGIDFGAAVAIDGNRMIIGAPGDAPANAVSRSFNQAAVNASLDQVVFDNPTTLTVGQALLYHQGGGNNSIGLIDGRVYYVKAISFDKKSIQLSETPSGQVVDLNASTTHPSADSFTEANFGAAYVFERTTANGIWTERQKIVANDSAPDRNFGAAVAVRGNEILIGAPVTANSDSNEAAYFFTLFNGNWQQQSKQTGSGDFGRAVSLAGAFGVVGAPQANSTGLAYVYSVSVASIAYTTTLTASDAQTGEQFGAALAATTNRIVVGAPEWDAPTNYAYPGDASHNQQGRAFVFDLTGSTWVRVARLTADAGLTQAEATSEARDGARFGAAVAADGKYVVVGAPGQSSPTSQTGSAYVFYNFSDSSTGYSSWTRSSGSVRLQDSNPAQNDNFGQAVAVWANSDGTARLMAGIPGHDETNGRLDLGAVRTFVTNGIVPSATASNVYAEKLPDPAPGASSKFGSVTYYDPTSRMLFIADPGQNRVYVYVNEGLYWRPIDVDANTLGFQNLTGGSGFGSAIDMSGDTLVIGAPQANSVYVFTRT